MKKQHENVFVGHCYLNMYWVIVVWGQEKKHVTYKFKYIDLTVGELVDKHFEWCCWKICVEENLKELK